MALRRTAGAAKPVYTVCCSCHDCQAATVSAMEFDGGRGSGPPPGGTQAGDEAHTIAPLDCERRGGIAVADEAHGRSANELECDAAEPPAVEMASPRRSRQRRRGSVVRAAGRSSWSCRPVRRCPRRSSPAGVRRLSRPMSWPRAPGANASSVREPHHAETGRNVVTTTTVPSTYSRDESKGPVGWSVQCPASGSRQRPEHAGAVETAGAPPAHDARTVDDGGRLAVAEHREVGDERLQHRSGALRAGGRGQRVQDVVERADAASGTNRSTDRRTEEG